MFQPLNLHLFEQLLSAGIGGNSKCSVIVCSRMESSHINETVSTLKFGQSFTLRVYCSICVCKLIHPFIMHLCRSGEACSLIQNSLSNKSTMLIRVLENLDKEIKALEDVIRSKERWIDVIETRQDVNAEEGTRSYSISIYLFFFSVITSNGWVLVLDYCPLIMSFCLSRNARESCWRT